MNARIMKRLNEQAKGADGEIYMQYAWIFSKEILAMLVSVILTSSLAYVLWIGKPDVYFLYKYKLQGGVMVWLSKWVVFALMTGSALAIFFAGTFFALAAALNITVLITNPDILRIQALSAMENKIKR